MKLHREQFLAAAMMLSASQTLGACRSKPDTGNEGINAEGVQNIGQNGPSAEPGGPSLNRTIQPVGARAGLTPTPLRVNPVNESFVAAPTNERIVAAPTNERIVAAPTNEKIILPAPTNEKILVAPVNEKGFGTRPVPTLTAPAKTVTPPPPLTVPKK